MAEQHNPMKLQLVGSRARSVGIDLDHSTLSRVHGSEIRLTERTQIGRILIACFIAMFGLTCFPGIVDKQVRGVLDGITFFLPSIGIMALALLFALREKVLILDRRANERTVEPWMGPVRIRRSVEPMGGAEKLLLHSEYMPNQEGGPYWLFTLSVEGLTETRFYSRSYSRILKFAQMLAEFLSVDFADYSEQESRTWSR